MRLHHNLIGFSVAFATNRTEALRHEGSMVERIVEQLDLPSVLPALFLVLGNVLFDDFNLRVGFLRRAVDHR